MNIAKPTSVPVPSHFAPPARAPSTRRHLYHQPTLHIRAGSLSPPRPSSQEIATLQSSPGLNHASSFTSQSAIVQQFKRTTSGPPPASPQTQTFSTQPQQQKDQRASLHRQSTASSNISSTPSGGPLIPANHPSSRHHHAPSSSTSNSSINRNTSGYSNHRYPSLTPPLAQVRPMSSSNGDTYVGRLRRAKATVWSARGQQEDLDRSNSKEDKAKKYAKQKATASRVIYPPLISIEGFLLMSRIS